MGGDEGWGVGVGGWRWLSGAGTVSDAMMAKRVYVFVYISNGRIGRRMPEEAERGVWCVCGTRHYDSSGQRVSCIIMPFNNASSAMFLLLFFLFSFFFNTSNGFSLRSGSRAENGDSDCQWSLFRLDFVKKTFPFLPVVTRNENLIILN